MAVPEVDSLVTSTLTERLQRMNQTDLPRLATMDRSALRVLKKKVPVTEAPPAVVAGEG